MSGSFILIGGTSGTGKSTRVALMVQYLLRTTPVEMIYHPTGKLIGFLFPEHNMLIYGNPTKSGKWCGADSSLSTFGDTPTFMYWIQDMVVTRGYRLILEGSSTLHTYRYLPMNLNSLGINQGEWHTFSYNSPEEYISRVLMRTGCPPDLSKGGWTHNKHYHQRWGATALEEASNLLNFSAKVVQYPFDAPLESIGCALGLPPGFSKDIGIVDIHVPNRSIFDE